MLSSTRERIVGYAVDTLFGPGSVIRDSQRITWVYGCINSSKIEQNKFL